MRKSHRVWTLSLLLLGASPSFAQQPKAIYQQPTDAYAYPVVPGTEAWKQFKTTRAMLDACQIPAKTLRGMSTAGLVVTCLNYPLLSDVLLANSLQQGLDGVTADFNGLRELLQRPDAGQELFNAYQKMDPRAVQAQTEKKKGAFSFTFTYIELLLAQPVVVGRLSPAERRLLLQEGLRKLKAKDEYLDTFGGFGELTSALVLGRVLEKENRSATYLVGKRSPAMQSFLASGRVVDTQVINQVVADAQRVLE